MKVSMERQRVTARGNSEIGGVSLSVHLNTAQGPFIFSRGRKHSSDAFDGAQISVAEGVIALHRCVSRSLLLQWPNQPARWDISHRCWVDQRCLEPRGQARSDILHIQS